MHIYYDGVRIFDSGLIPGSGQSTVNFGPGASTNVFIVMNEGGNSVTNTAWNYTVTVVSPVAFSYLTFTEDTNYAKVAIKFAPPPFATLGSSTNFTLSDFNSSAAADYF